MTPFDYTRFWLWIMAGWAAFGVAFLVALYWVIRWAIVDALKP